jgi:tRNA (guanine10-N2)-methyltransferase
LKNPDVTYYYYEFFGLDAGRIPENPFNYFFGRWVKKSTTISSGITQISSIYFFYCFQISDSERTAVAKYSLKTRHFIGNTSMDPQLSMIMANLAQIDNGHIVVDPFVGTGCLLLF